MNQIKKLVITLLFLLVIPFIIAQSLSEKESLQLELDNLTSTLVNLGYDATTIKGGIYE